MLHEILRILNEFVIIACQKPLNYLAQSFASHLVSAVFVAIAALFRSLNEPLIALNCLIGLNEKKNAVNYYNFTEMLGSLIAFKQQSVIP